MSRGRMKRVPRTRASSVDNVINSTVQLSVWCKPTQPSVCYVSYLVPTPLIYRYYRYYRSHLRLIQMWPDNCTPSVDGKGLPSNHPSCRQLILLLTRHTFSYRFLIQTFSYRILLLTRHTFSYRFLIQTFSYRFPGRISSSSGAATATSF